MGSQRSLTICECEGEDGTVASEYLARPQRDRETTGPDSDPCWPRPELVHYQPRSVPSRQRSLKLANRWRSRTAPDRSEVSPGID